MPEANRSGVTTLLLRSTGLSLALALSGSAHVDEHCATLATNRSIGPWQAAARTSSCQERRSSRDEQEGSAGDLVISDCQRAASGFRRWLPSSLTRSRKLPRDSPCTFEVSFAGAPCRPQRPHRS